MFWVSQDGRCRHTCGHCFEVVSPGTMGSHIRNHTDSEFLTIRQLRIHRSQLKFCGSKQNDIQMPGPSTARPSSRPSSPPSSSSSSSSDNEDSGDDSHDQQRKVNFNGTLITYTFSPHGSELYDMLQQACPHMIFLLCIQHYHII